MKKIVSAFFVVFMSFCCAVSTYAYDINWPPENFPMSYDVLSPDYFKVFMDSMKITIGSSMNIGWILMGTLASVGLINIIFADFFESFRIQEGVNKRKFNRKVNLADFNQNFDDIVDDKVRGMILSRAATKKYRHLFPQAELEERLHQRQLSYEAEVAWQEQNPDKIIDLSIRRRALGAQASIDYSREYGDLDVASRVQSRMRGIEAQDQVVSQNPDTIMAQDVKRRERSAQADMSWRTEHHETVLEQGITHREQSAISEIAWRERFPDTAIQAAVERREQAAQAEIEWSDGHQDTVKRLRVRRHYRSKPSDFSPMKKSASYPQHRIDIERDE